MSKTIAFLKFKVLLEQEIRTFWHLLTSLEYSERWLSANQPLTLTLHPGDNRYPFRAIDISPEAFISEQIAVGSHLRENTLVNFVTTFECYLSELLERMLYLDPSLLFDSDMPIFAKELASVVQYSDVRRWLAAKVTNKYLRNKTHEEMIQRIGELCKAGVAKSLKSEIEEWSRWSLVRNCVVHTSRQITDDLVKVWPDRFSSVGGAIELTNEELARIHHLALKIAGAIDSRAVKTRIQKHDELLIAREIFVQKGIAKPNMLVAELNKIMQVKATQADVQKMLSAHIKGACPDSWQLSCRELSNLIG